MKTHHIEVFQLANGQKLFDTQVQNVVDAMASFTPPALMGQTALPTSYKDTLEPVIVKNWH